MLGKAQSLKRPLDLNKPLPLSPPDSADVSTRNSSSSYSMMLNTEIFSADKNPLNSSNNPVSSGIHIVDRYKPYEASPNTFLASRTMTSEVTDAGVDAEQKLQQPKSPTTDIRPPDSVKEPALPVSVFSIKDDFKSFNYDEVDERPLTFHPQTRLIDLPRQERKRMTSFKFFKQRASNKAAERPFPQTANSQFVSPPRPLRPPRPPPGLCPSPPYNPNNMPSWTGPEVFQAQGPMRQVGRKIHVRRTNDMKVKSMSDLVHKSINFVSRSDLQPEFKYETRTNTGHCATSISYRASLDKLRTNNARPLKHSASTYLRLLRGDKDDAVTHVLAPTEVNSYSLGIHEGTRGPRWKTRRDIVGELDHVPEDATLHSFSPGTPQSLQIKSRCSYRIGSSRQPRILSDHDQDASLHSQPIVTDTNTFGLNTECRERGYQRERNCAQAVSDEFREHYRREWDQANSRKLLQSAESFTASYSKPSASPQETNVKNFRQPDHSQDVYSNSSYLTPQQPIRIDPNNPRLSVTMARLAQLSADDYSPSVNATIAVMSNWSGHETGMSSHLADQTDPSPSFLQRITPPHTPVSKFPNQKGMVTPELVMSSSEQRPGSNSSSLASLDRRDHVFTGSTVESIPETPVTDHDGWLDRSRSRSTSPLLPPLPLRVRPSVPSPLQMATHRPSDYGHLRRRMPTQRSSSDAITDLDYQPSSIGRTRFFVAPASGDSSMNAKTSDGTSVYHIYHSEAAPICAAYRTASPPLTPSTIPPPVPLRSPLRPTTRSQNMDA